MNISFDKKFIFFLLVCFLIFFQGILKLPVMDRDEARFATASKTMLMNADYIDIKMIDEKRYKKPVGIYWAQALMNKIFGSYPYDKIWIYRAICYNAYFGWSCHHINTYITKNFFFSTSHKSIPRTNYFINLFKIFCSIG